MEFRIKLKSEQLTEYRLRAGMDTQQKLGDAMGLDRSVLSRILNGFMAPGEKSIAGLLGAFADTAVLDVSPSRIEVAAEMVGLNAVDFHRAVLFANLFDIVEVATEEKVA